MNGSEWNKIFQGLFSGGSDAATGYIIGRKKSDAQETYELAMKNVKDAALKLSGSQNQVESDANLNQNNQVESPEAQMTKLFSGFDPNAILENNISGTQSSVLTNQSGPVISPRVKTEPETTKNDLVNAYYKGVGELTKLGEYGKPYLDPFGEFMKSMTPKAPITKTDVTGGYVIKYDDNGNILKKTKIDDLPKPEKNTIQKYSKMTLEEAEQLTDNELSGDAFFYLPKETQTALMQKYPALQQLHDQKFKEGDYSKNIKGPGSKRFSAPKLNFEDKTVESIGEQLYKVRKEIEGTGWENADPKTIEAHDKLVQQLKGYGVDDWVSFSEGLGKGEKVKNLKQDQQDFKQDLNDIIYTKNGIYDMLITLWNLDSSNEQGAKEIQRQADALYAWLGNNIYQKVDYPMEKAIYDYVNSEISKLWNSKFGGK
jgi:hypothetical protein